MANVITVHFRPQLWICLLATWVLLIIVANTVDIVLRPRTNIYQDKYKDKLSWFWGIATICQKCKSVLTSQFIYTDEVMYWRNANDKKWQNSFDNKMSTLHAKNLFSLQPVVYNQKDQL